MALIETTAPPAGGAPSLAHVQKAKLNGFTKTGKEVVNDPLLQARMRDALNAFCGNRHENWTELEMRVRDSGFPTVKHIHAKAKNRQEVLTDNEVRALIVTLSLPAAFVQDGSVNMLGRTPTDAREAVPPFIKKGDADVAAKLDKLLLRAVGGMSPAEAMVKFSDHEIPKAEIARMILEGRHPISVFCVERVLSALRARSQLVPQDVTALVYEPLPGTHVAAVDDADDDTDAADADEVEEDAVDEATPDEAPADVTETPAGDTNPTQGAGDTGAAEEQLMLQGLVDLANAQPIVVGEIANGMMTEKGLDFDGLATAYKNAGVAPRNSADAKSMLHGRACPDHPERLQFVWNDTRMQALLGFLDSTPDPFTKAVQARVEKGDLPAGPKQRGAPRSPAAAKPLGDKATGAPAKVGAAKDAAPGPDKAPAVEVAAKDMTAGLNPTEMLMLNAAWEGIFGSALEATKREANQRELIQLLDLDLRSAVEAALVVLPADERGKLLVRILRM